MFVCVWTMMTKGRNCTYNKTEATEDIGFGHPAVTFKQLAQRFACCSVADVSDEYLRRSHSDNDNVIEVFFTKQLLLEENKTSIQFKCWLPSVVWRCWLSGRKGIRPAKNEWWGPGIVICLERGANDLHMVQFMLLPPIISCSSKIQNGLPI